MGLDVRPPAGAVVELDQGELGASGGSSSPRLSHCFAGLSERERDVVLLHVVRGFSFRMISLVMQRPRSTLHRWYRLAMVKLRARAPGP